MMSTTKAKLKPITDILLTLALLFLMTYELLGSMAHEVIGVIMFVLFIIHHILNINWAKSLFKGKQTLIRIFQNIIVFLVLISFIGSVVSGIIISRHLFVFLSFKHIALANRLHMLSAYWGFVFMSLHLGMHFNTISLMIKKKKDFSKRAKLVFKILCVLLFVYGVFAFFKRDLLGYLLLKNQFFFLDNNEFLPFYLFDYMAVMFSFGSIANFISLKIKKQTIKKA